MACLCQHDSIAGRIWNLKEAMAPAMPRNPKKGADPKPKDEGQPARQQPAEKATKNQKADKSQKEQKSSEKPTAEQKQNETAPKEQKQAEKAQTQPKVADKAPAEKQQGKNQKEQKQAEKPQQEQKEQKQQDKDGKQPDKKPDVKQQNKKQNGKQLDKKQDNKQQDRMQDAKLQVQKQDQSQTQQGLLQDEQKLQAGKLQREDLPSDVPQLLTKASKDRLPVRSPINPGEATPVIDMLQGQKQEERPSKKRKEPEKDSRLSNTAWEEFLMLDSKSAAQAPLAQERGLANQEPLASSLRAPQTLEEKRAQLKEQLMAEGVHVSPARVEKEENLETKMRLACT